MLNERNGRRGVRATEKCEIVKRKVMIIIECTVSSKRMPEEICLAHEYMSG